MPSMPLDGVRVLDLSHALAGPFCSTMLADFGADVIKLEPRGAGDISRAWGAPLPGGETAYFVSLHRNKKGIEVDLKAPAGKDLFFSLAAKCDVVLENYRVGALARLGLGYEKARERNPGIIYCSVSGFGQDGPYRDRAALDLIVQSESGMISTTGEPGGHGVRCGVSIADMTAGMYAAFGIMLALRVKERTGRGQAIDVSMLEGQLSLLGSMIGGYFADGELPLPMGTAYKALLPYQTFRTRTRDLALAVGSEKLWKVFCPAIGCPELTDDPRYRTNADRARNRDTLIARLQEVFLTRPYEEWEPHSLGPGHPDGRDQLHRPGRRSSPGDRPRRAGRDRASAGGQGEDGGRAGPPVRDPGLGAHARADARRAHRSSAARGARAERRGDRGAPEGGGDRRFEEVTVDCYVGECGGHFWAPADEKPYRGETTRMNGAESLARTLVAGGVDVCFTNPGTSEMHFVAALDRVEGIRCVLGLFEGVVTGAADGYWRMADRPAATLLHLGPGLGNGLANLHNARKASSGIVNVVGEHATYHVKHDAPLTSDIEGIARPVSGWVRTSPTSRAVAADGAAAIVAARTAPGQVATLILPADTAWGDADGVAPIPAVPARAAVDAATIDRCAQALRSGEPAMLMLTGLAVRERGLALAGRIATATGARVIAQGSNARIQRGAGRVPIERLPYPVDQALAVLKDVRHLILVGAKAPGGLLRLSRQAERAHAGRLPDPPARHHRRGFDRRARGPGGGGRRQEERRGRAAALAGPPCPPAR